MASLSEAAHYSDSPVCVLAVLSYCWLALARQHTILVFPCVLGVLFCIDAVWSQILGVRIRACGLQFCIFVSIRLRDEAFIKSIQ